MKKFDPCFEAKNIITDLVVNLKEDIFNSNEEYGDLTIVEFYFKNLHPERIMAIFIDNVLPYKKQIVARDVNFFLKNESIFEGLPEDKIKYYSSVIASGTRISEEYRKTIWEYFDSLLACAEYYQKVK